ncbi:MAG: pyrroloquinoline quinone biosynthesis protein PqqB [Acidobacteria bacterium]|nr:pyrroloquinoline quinone biosynthesis protein PqqB [Acidobacteriota bacterium]
MAKTLTFALLLLSACAHVAPPATAPWVVVLGIAQDGGYPQAGCKRDDCIAAWRDPSLRRHVASLGIVDPVSGERWIIDATPDFPEQLHRLDLLAPSKTLPSILLTHAHIGHYTGLMHLGREVLGAHAVPVYAMPRMRAFLESNGPWSQLVALKNIELRPLETTTRLNARISIETLVVPHRDEFSETVGFIIRGPSRAILWLPDIDKWEKWSIPIESVLARVDVAYVDGTFHDANELPGRDLREIPHPLIVETLARLDASSRKKIRFIHLNQSNPWIRGRHEGVAAEGELELLGARELIR